jgi:hypothetical protein
VLSLLLRDASEFLYMCFHHDLDGGLFLFSWQDEDVTSRDLALEIKFRDAKDSFAYGCQKAMRNLIKSAFQVDVMGLADENLQIDTLRIVPRKLL